MDANQIRRLKPELSRCYREFDDCFARRDTRAHLPAYVEGQLSDLPRKSITAAVSPITTTRPISYFWRATGQTPITHTMKGVSDTTTFTWNVSPHSLRRRRIRPAGSANRKSHSTAASQTS